DFFFDTDSEDAIGAGMLADTTVTATLISGDSPADNTLGEPVSVSVRVVNPDDQYDEQDGLTWETTGVLPNANATRQLFTEAEMHMVVNPKDPLNAAVCSHDGLSGFRALRHVYTKDGGATWTSLAVGPPGSASADGLASNAFRFDPMNAVDAFGNIYVIYGGEDPSNGRRSIFAHQSRDGGATFPLVITMPFTASGGLDRWTAATGPDPALPGNQVLYVACVDFNSNNGDILVAGVSIAPGGSLAANYASRIVNDASAGGNTFFQHGTPSVGPGGELYVSYIRGNVTGAPTAILMDVDMDGLGGSNSSLGTSDVIVATTALPFRVFPTVQPSRGYGVIPMHKVVQTGTTQGRVVIVYTTTATPLNPAEDLNVVTQYSDTYGATWSTPTLVHPVDGAHQFHPWLDADPVRGDLYVTWYDSTNDPLTNRAVQRFAAISTSGASWGTPLLLSQGKSDARNNGLNDYLEYNGVAAYDGRVYACWADNSNFNGQNPGGTRAPDQFDVYVAFFMLDPDE
ncbi:MAG: sialidase family protein, partial [Planctomycetota bacterium]